jgi:hypothetical protein
MNQTDVDIASLSPPVARPTADPAKIQRMADLAGAITLTA